MQTYFLSEKYSGVINFTGNMITINNKAYRLEYPIRDAVELNDEVVVLFHPNASHQRYSQFPNLIALSPEGERKWTAELPTAATGERYYRFHSRNPIVVYSVYAWECEIDHETGRIKQCKLTR